MLCVANGIEFIFEVVVNVAADVTVASAGAGAGAAAAIPVGINVELKMKVKGRKNWSDIEINIFFLSFF